MRKDAKNNSIDNNVQITFKCLEAQYLKPVLRGWFGLSKPVFDYLKSDK